MRRSRSSAEPSPAGRRPDIAASQRSFWLMFATFMLLLAIAFAASWGGIRVVDATRAYATGGTGYVRAQKTAVLDITRYAFSRDEADYQAFRAAVTVPLSQHLARLALERSLSDASALGPSVIAAQPHPDDASGFVWLFHRLSWWHPFAATVEDWREADQLVAELVTEGAAIHARIGDGTFDPAAQRTLLDAIAATDDHLTEREERFSDHLRETARGATFVVVSGLGATLIAVWAIGMAIAIRLFRRQLALHREIIANEERFRDFAEVASDWYWETDAQHRIIYLSERPLAFAATMGAAIGSNLIEILKNRSAGEEHAEFVAALTRHRPFRGLRLSLVGADGKRFYWSVAAKPHRDADGRFMGYRGAGSDITDAVRDAQMLLDAKERAEVANRAKSEFLANMSHELRTPLNAILGFSEMIGGRVLGPGIGERYAAYGDDIHQSGRHLLSIIDDILDLSKIEAGRVQLHEDEVGLSELVAQTLILVGDRFKEAGIDFRVALPPHPTRLAVDERRLKQCLVNLLSNAIKFTPAGGNVTLSASFARDGRLMLAVADTGIGIEEGQIETVLAPFGQVESAFSRRQHGTGLGLPLAKSLIELHGGTLDIRSAVGVGTTVTLALPTRSVIAERTLAAS
jgi:PAS domain S-box-containing protein